MLLWPSDTMWPNIGASESKKRSSVTGDLGRLEVDREERRGAARGRRAGRRWHGLGSRGLAGPLTVTSGFDASQRAKTIVLMHFLSMRSSSVFMPVSTSKALLESRNAPLM